MEPSSTFKPTLLIVDDNEEILEFLADDLADDYEIFAENSVRKALPHLQTEMVHLVISDILMPETDGLSFCHMIKSNMEHSHIPVILLTAKNGIPAQIEGLEHGADAYIEKPFSPEYLQVQIANLLDNRSRLRSYFSSMPLTTIHSMAQSAADTTFLDKLHQIIIQHLDDPRLDVDLLSNKLYISRPTLYRKIKLITDMTPGELITVTRLKKSAEYILEKKYPIGDIALMVGFNSCTHFGRCFQKQFGVAPSKYTGVEQLT